MRLFKKNQIIIYVIALMLMTAGYLNYTTNEDSQKSLETSLQMESKDDGQIAEIGDATLVNSNDIISQNNVVTENESTNTSDKININAVESNKNEIENEDKKENQATDSQLTKETTSASISKDEYFKKSKLERETMFSQMLETYETILNTNNSLETQKQMATEEITKINNLKNSIMICENLIASKGFENCVVFVNGNSINVIIGTEELKTEEVAQIQNIVSRELKGNIEDIHISCK